MGLRTVLTILVAVAKIGSIYAKARRDRQAFQAAVTIIMMLIILNNEQQIKNNKNKYRRVDEF